MGFEVFMIPASIIFVLYIIFAPSVNDYNEKKNKGSLKSKESYLGYLTKDENEEKSSSRTHGREAIIRSENNIYNSTGYSYYSFFPSKEYYKMHSAKGRGGELVMISNKTLNLWRKREANLVLTRINGICVVKEIYEGSVDFGEKGYYPNRSQDNRKKLDI
jgi:hypothetical protein